jgi:hypothetical protein
MFPYNKNMKIMERGGKLIYFLIPQYIDEIGDCCIFCNDNKDVIYHKKTEYVLKELCKERCIDLAAVKRKCSRILSQKNLIPLYLSKDEILIPIKVRRPRVLRDGGYGYVNACAVEKIVDGKIVFKNGRTILFIDNKRSIVKRLKAVKTLEEAFNDKLDSYIEYQKDFKGSATKEDVAIILREILDIKKKIEDFI